MIINEKRKARDEVILYKDLSVGTYMGKSWMRITLVATLVSKEGNGS
jgi:hypothetical protein